MNMTLLGCSHLPLKMYSIIMCRHNFNHISLFVSTICTYVTQYELVLELVFVYTCTQSHTQPVYVR